MPSELKGSASENYKTETQHKLNLRTLNNSNVGLDLSKELEDSHKQRLPVFHTAKQSILENRKIQTRKGGKVTLNPIDTIKVVAS